MYKGYRGTGTRKKLIPKIYEAKLTEMEKQTIQQ